MSDQFKISSAASPEKITKHYGEPGFSLLTQMKADYTTNSHSSLAHISLKLVGRFYLLSLGMKGLKPGSRRGASACIAGKRASVRMSAVPFTPYSPNHSRFSLDSLGVGITLFGHLRDLFPEVFVFVCRWAYGVLLWELFTLGKFVPRTLFSPDVPVCGGARGTVLGWQLFLLGGREGQVTTMAPCLGVPL